MLTSIGGCAACVCVAGGGLACLYAVLRFVWARIKGKAASKSDDCDSDPCDSHESGCNCCK